MSDDIVKRLRTTGKWSAGSVMREAADLIERQREALRTAQKAFAAIVSHDFGWPEYRNHAGWAYVAIDKVLKEDRMNKSDAITAAANEATQFGAFDITHFKRSLAASGYAVVPIEATEGMLEAGNDAARSVRSSGVGGMTVENQFRMKTARERAFWNAMLAAAQKEDGE